MSRSLLSPALQAKLQPKLQQLRVKWQALQPRERVLLQGLGALLAICVAWFGGWQPLQQGVLSAELRLQNASNQALYIQQQAARIQALRASDNAEQQVVTSAESLPGLLNRTAATLEMQITRVQSQNDARVLVFDEVSFDAVLQFIDTLEQSGVIVESVDVSETNEPGIVRVRRLQVRTAS
ncbi:MAG: type 2a secretion system assembly platform protein GspM [Idiomarinaceae bacterium HL-53]|nr:MAG: type 2a secretion system assembly platform protein GspM [Idiomarinaceae bacterium HL-53]CUS47251.1 general secretion pathway protein M [Idiomarinaceae bacterium HL-53]